MKQGFVKVAAASCAVAVADVRENTRVILETIHTVSYTHLTLPTTSRV